MSKSYETKQYHTLSPKAENALLELIDYFYNHETPAKIVEKKPSLDYYDNRYIKENNKTIYSMIQGNYAREKVMLLDSNTRKKYDYDKVSNIYKSKSGLSVNRRTK